ncbi:hypothetical protein ACWD6I_26565 [Streptomyces sp. NPDC002454]
MAHATHVHSAIQVEGTGELLVLTMPRSQVTLDGNWDVLGLRATHSVDYHCDDAFVLSGTTNGPPGGGRGTSRCLASCTPPRYGDPGSAEPVTGLAASGLLDPRCGPRSHW